MIAPYIFKNAFTITEETIFPLPGRKDDTVSYRCTLKPVGVDTTTAKALDLLLRLTDDEIQSLCNPSASQREKLELLTAKLKEVAPRESELDATVNTFMNVFFSKSRNATWEEYLKQIRDSLKLQLADSESRDKRIEKMKNNLVVSNLVIEEGINGLPRNAWLQTLQAKKEDSDEFVDIQQTLGTGIPGTTVEGANTVMGILSEKYQKKTLSYDSLVAEDKALGWLVQSQIPDEREALKALKDAKKSGNIEATRETHMSVYGRRKRDKVVYVADNYAFRKEIKNVFGNEIQQGDSPFAVIGRFMQQKNPNYWERRNRLLGLCLLDIAKEVEGIELSVLKEHLSPVNIIKWVFCKSGKDRTGAYRAVRLAIAMEMHNAIENDRVMELSDTVITNIADRTKQVLLSGMLQFISSSASSADGIMSLKRTLPKAFIDHYKSTDPRFVWLMKEWHVQSKLNKKIGGSEDKNPEQPMVDELTKKMDELESKSVGKNMLFIQEKDNIIQSLNLVIDTKIRTLEIIKGHYQDKKGRNTPEVQELNTHINQLEGKKIGDNSVRFDEIRRSISDVSGLLTQLSCWKEKHTEEFLGPGGARRNAVRQDSTSVRHTLLLQPSIRERKTTRFKHTVKSHLRIAKVAKHSKHMGIVFGRNGRVKSRVSFKKDPDNNRLFSRNI